MILSNKKENGIEVPDRILIQILSTDEKQRIIKQGEKKYWGDRIYGVYKWDTKPEANESMPNAITTTITNNNNTNSNNSNIERRFSLVDIWCNLCSKVQSLCSPKF